jgi:hypothetical protein
MRYNEISYYAYKWQLINDSCSYIMINEDMKIKNQHSNISYKDIECHLIKFPYARLTYTYM